MKRVLAALLALSLLTPAAVAADTAEDCTGEVGNATVDDLCDRVESLEETNDELSDENVELEREVAELETELNDSRGFPPAMKEEMKAMGAWNPYEDEPATIIVRETGFFPMVYQYVGPGNGDANGIGGENTGGNFNGMNAWKRVAEAEQAKNQIENNGTFSFSIEYGLAGMNTTYTANTMGEYEATLDNLERDLNTPQGFAAWADWENDNRQSAETWSTVGLVGGAAAIVGVGIASAHIESRVGIVSRRQQKKKREKVTKQAAGAQKPSLIERLKRRFGR
ncbi:bZIP transcription factor [Natrinema thermotolerans]|uniref:BZIP transcription factor n=1 Tax=Natrinema thermotolerans TaxID=121872 RepID=A0AAF0PD55_9EURY|nr:bZIP transcription factor [Natrinema thermotolerans]QCC60250.1 bZIP transcription factor [Natrinema thermotolerans]QCC61162.1 bZIP transcription factor [Natrinema thermotolerans]WMT07269.1 bZIP transcription factor [Natrinema thermotolerans]